MNIKKKFWPIFLAVVMLFPTLLGLGSSIAQATESQDIPANVDIVLHKKKLESIPGTLVENDGTTNNALAGEAGLGNIHFTIYDVTAYFYSLVNAPTSMSYANAVIAVQAFNPTTDLSTWGATAIDDGYTSSNASDLGDLTFANVPSKSTVNGVSQNAVYVIVESPQSGVSAADNMVVSLPIVDPNDADEILDEIHLYPKNTVKEGNVTVSKKSNLADENGDDKMLEGAQLVIHRVQMQTDGVTPVVAGATGHYGHNGTEYLANTSSVSFTTDAVSGATMYTIDNPVWTTTATDAFVFETSDTGLFQIKQLILGEYFITEINPDQITTAGNFVTNNDAENQWFELVDDEDVDDPTFDFINDEIAIEKDNDVESFDVGKEIEYTVTTKVPHGINDMIDTDNDGVGDSPRYTSYVLTDSYHAELSFVTGSLVIEMDGVALTEGTSGDYVLSSETAGTPTTPGPGVNSYYTITFNNPHLTLDAEAELVITYKMFINEDAAMTEKWVNEITLEVGLDASLDQELDDVSDEGKEVRTDGYNFIKLDGSNTASGVARPLEGAEFVVKKVDDSGDTWYMQLDADNNVTWTQTPHAVPADEDYNHAYKFVTGSDGMITIKGLADGDYTLVEIKTPNDKYQTMPDQNFEILEGSFGTTAGLSRGGEEIFNYELGDLPSTGGAGLYMIYVAGIAVMICAASVYVRGARKEV